MTMKKLKYIDFISIAALFIAVFIPSIPLANIELLQPDSCGYLDMGRNLFSGRGAVISYDLNQYWPGRYHPFLPYMHPLYGILAGLVWILFGIKAVIGFNIMLHAANCVLLYLILSLYTDRITGFLIALFMGFSKSMVVPAISPLTEPLHLFVLLGAIFVYLKYDKTELWVGVMLALSCLVRVSGLYSVIAFLAAVLVLKGFSKEALRDHGRLILGLAVILIPYELFCYFRYGAFYPEYLQAAKVYKSAEIYAGAFYKNGIPVLNMPDLKLGMDVIGGNILGNLTGFIKSYGIVKYAMILDPFYFIYDLKKRRSPLVVIFFFQGLSLLLGYTLVHSWSAIYEFDRFSVITILTLGSIGFLSIKEIIDGYILSQGTRNAAASAAIFAAAFSFFFYFQMKYYLDFRGFGLNIFPEQQAVYRENREEVYGWIRRNTAEGDLIASHFLADAFLFERPFVSLPPDNALNEKNFNDYLNIYKPEYVLTYNGDMAGYLEAIGAEQVLRKGDLILLRNAF